MHIHTVIDAAILSGILVTCTLARSCAHDDYNPNPKAGVHQ